MGRSDSEGSHANGSEGSGDRCHGRRQSETWGEDPPTGCDELENLDKTPNSLGGTIQIILTKGRKMRKTGEKADLTLEVKVSQAREVPAADPRHVSSSRGVQHKPVKTAAAELGDHTALLKSRL